MHRQEIHRNPPSWVVMDKIEVNNIMDDLNPVIQGEGV